MLCCIQRLVSNYLMPIKIVYTIYFGLMKNLLCSNHPLFLRHRVRAKRGTIVFTRLYSPSVTKKKNGDLYAAGQKLYYKAIVKQFITYRIIWEVIQLIEILDSPICLIIGSLSTLSHLIFTQTKINSLDCPIQCKGHSNTNYQIFNCTHVLLTSIISPPPSA